VGEKKKTRKPTELSQVDQPTDGCCFHQLQKTPEVPAASIFDGHISAGLEGEGRLVDGCIALARNPGIRTHGKDMGNFVKEIDRLLDFCFLGISEI
jgi:hypothetical protein